MTDDDALIARLLKMPPPGEPFGPCTEEAKATFARSVAHYVDAQEAADRIAALTAEIQQLREERADFHMDYRMKCDEETKRLHVAFAKAEAALAERDKDAERYRFLRSPLAAEAGPVQRELWQEMGVKLCREEAMDKEVDAAMNLLAAAIRATARIPEHPSSGSPPPERTPGAR